MSLTKKMQLSTWWQMISGGPAAPDETDYEAADLETVIGDLIS